MKPLRTSARITEVADTGSRLSILFSRETALAKDVILKPLFAEIETLTQQLSEATALSLNSMLLIPHATSLSAE